MVMGRIADTLQDRGHLNEALIIYQNEQLPMCEEMGDIRSQAIIKSKIDAILQIQGTPSL
jgi:hypothetical protein